MLGIFGGSFNPIHYGHLRLAEELADTLPFSEIRFIPAAIPPLKSSPEVSAEHRAAMVGLAIHQNPRFRLDTRELARSGPSYTIDTLQSLRAEVGINVSMALVLGLDAFCGLTRWHQWPSLLSFSHIVVATRPEYSLDGLTPALHTLLQTHQTSALNDLHQQPSGLIYVQAITPLAISASLLRALYSQGHSTRYLLPESVAEYIEKHQLYRPSTW